MAVRKQPKPSPYDRCLCGGQRRFCGDEFRLAPPLMGALSDLARRYGVSKSTVHEWAERRDFPPCLQVVATNVRVWDLQAVDNWRARGGKSRYGSLLPREGGEP